MNKTACFSGYRPEKFSFILIDGQEAYLNLQSKIRAAIITAVEDGFDTFLCGMARGLDLICGGLVLQLKQERPQYSGIRLIAVPPFPEHGFGGPWGVIHSLVMSRADDLVFPAENNSRRAYHLRNRDMVDHSSRLICYYDGQPGGTGYTVDYARQKGLEVVNLQSLK